MDPARKPLARELGQEELSTLCLDLGARRFQAQALWHWLHQKGLRSFDQATDLPKRLRNALSDRLELRAVRLDEESLAHDDTRKFLLELRDGEKVEMVLIPEGSRNTLCVSTQVGCPVGCVFCASGLLGVRRNLDRHEILDQFLLARELLGDGELTNVVIMGMGEPMLNLDELLPALDHITDPDGFCFSPRRITVSASGYPDKIRRFSQSGKSYNLALSLHTADAEQRKQLVPTAQHEPRELIAAAKDHFRATGREPTIEIVLLRGRNDRPQDAEALARLLNGLQCTVNLIPWNRVEGTPMALERPHEDRVEAFREALERRGQKVTVRRKRGNSMDAACGQLRLRSIEH